MLCDGQRIEQRPEVKLTQTQKMLNQPENERDMLALLAHAHTKEQGFKRLMQAYQERVYWHVRRLVLTHENADDVVQNTFLKAWRAIDQFQGNSSLFTWLYRIGTNEALSFLEKESRSASTLATASDSDIQLSAEPYLEGEAIEELLQRAIDQLPAKQKAVFNMRYYDELPYEEIASITGTSEGALKASYHLAMKKIEQFVKSAMQQQ